MTAFSCVLMWVAAAPFGPFGDVRHPVVGPLAAVPGDGPVPLVTPAPEEIPLHKVKGVGTTRPAGSNPLYVDFLLYRDFFTKVDGSRCQHYPTCSAYGAQAVGRYNILGVLMTMDRLWASGASSSVRNSPLVYGVGPTPRHYDPVEASTFFFSYPLAAWFGPSIPRLDEILGRNRPVPDEETTAQKGP